MSPPGVRWILACTLRAEIACIERFPNARHLVAYSLAPRTRATGAEDDGPPHGRHVGQRYPRGGPLEYTSHSNPPRAGACIVGDPKTL